MNFNKLLTIYAKFKNMIHVIFDTSGIGQNKNVGDGNYSALKTLVESEKIRVHIPFVVKKEVETQEKDFYLQQHNQLKKAIKAFDKILKSNELNKSINDIKIQIDTLHDEIIEDFSRYSLAWIEGLNAIVYDITLEQTNKAWDAYFDGTAPLKTPKLRADIPDSFICRSIEEIIKNISTDSNFVLIANDNKVIETFNTNTNIDVYRTIDEFITSDKIKDLLAETDKSNDLSFIILGDEVPKVDIEATPNNHFIPLFTLSSLIAAHENKTSFIHNYINMNLEDSLVDETFEGMPLSNEYNQQAKINTCEDISEVNINFRETTHYGKDNFGFGFSAKVTVQAEYFINKSDFYGTYYSDEPKDHLMSIEDWNKHLFLAVNIVTLEVSGIISVNLNFEDSTYENLKLLRPSDFKNVLDSHLDDAVLNIDTINEIIIVDSD